MSDPKARAEEERKAAKLRAEQLAIWAAKEAQDVELANRATELRNVTESERLLKEASAARQNKEYWERKS